MDSKYSYEKKESIGPWWICGNRRVTLDDAFVYTFGSTLWLVETSLREGVTSDLNNYFGVLKAAER
jgi:hypothetical protein